ncbi:MAG: TonB-dependent receptor [Gallionella sp.]|nr:TonB-dependent receptor [Gallionella sp.]
MKRLFSLLILSSGAVLVCAEEIQTLDEIKVTGKRDDVSERRESSTQKVVVDRREIENMSVMTIADVIGKLPGVEIKGDAQRARGMTRDSVSVLIDGERQSSQAVLGAMGRLPSGDLERVEILRGSSAEYGGASSVTVNLVMKKAIPKRSTEMRVGVGMRGNELNEQLAWTKNGGEGGFAWSLPIGLIWNNAPMSMQLDRQNSTAGVRNLWQQESASALTKLGHHAISPRLSWKNGSDSFTVLPMFFYGPMTRNTTSNLSAFTNPAAGTGQAYNGERLTRESGLSRTLRLRVEGEKHLGNAKLTARTSLNNNRRSSDTWRDVYSATNVLSSFSDHLLSQDNEWNSALRWDQSYGVSMMSVGAELVRLQRDDQQNFSGAQASFLALSRDGILWVQNDWSPQASFTLTTGLRAENSALNSNGVSQQQTSWLPSLAARWEPLDKWVVRSSLGAGLKMPRLDEISNAAVPSIGANTPVEADKRGNPNLRPERSVNFEAVLEHYLAENAGVLGANLYVRSTQDFTERHVLLEGARWVDRPYNAGSAQHWGVELDGKIRTDSLGWKGASVKAHLTLPHAEVSDTQLGVTRMARDTPSFVFSMGLDQSLPKLKSTYGVTLQHSGRSATAIPGEQWGYTRARSQLDAFWLYQISPQYKVRMAGQNLLAADTVRQNNVTSAENAYQLSNSERGYRGVMLTLEGRL